MQWWGPKDFTAPVSKMDLRVGGKYLNCMRSPEGKDYWSTGTYREIVPMERLVSTFEFEGTPGHVSLDTATFEEHEGRTIGDRSCRRFFALTTRKANCTVTLRGPARELLADSICCSERHSGEGRTMTTILIIAAVLASAYIYATLVFYYGFKNWRPL